MRLLKGLVFCVRLLIVSWWFGMVDVLGKVVVFCLVCLVCYCLLVIVFLLMFVILLLFFGFVVYCWNVKFDVVLILKVYGDLMIVY